MSGGESHEAEIEHLVCLGKWLDRADAAYERVSASARMAAVKTQPEETFIRQTLGYHFVPLNQLVVRATSTRWIESDM